MSSFQYYDFKAIDYPLSDEDMAELRTISTRATITTTSFVNGYNWGDFKGNQVAFMKRWFDLHLYMASWGTRRLMIRVPKRLVKRSLLDPFLRGWGMFEVIHMGDNLILDFPYGYEEDECDYNDVDYSDLLSVMATIRSDILSGDWRILYLAWLWTVDQGDLLDDEREPLTGIGPLNAPLIAFAEFFQINPDLVAAAAEQSSRLASNSDARHTSLVAIAAIPDNEKTNLLCRLAEGDPHVAMEVRKKVSDAALAASSVSRARLRTAAELRARAIELREARKIAALKQQEFESEQQRIAAAKAYQNRLNIISGKGESIWKEVEAEIRTGSGKSYDAAAQLLFDLKTLAEEHGKIGEFFDKLEAIRKKHARKQRFIERIETLQRR